MTTHDSDPDIEGVFKAITAEIQDRRVLGNGGRVELFVDTVDIRRALLGMWRYVKRGRPSPQSVDESPPIDITGFESDSALIHALLAAGYLGPIRLLPPHEEELLRALRSTDNVFFDARRTNLEREHSLRRRFLAETGVLGERVALPRPISEMTNDELTTFVRKQAGSAKRYFKAFQFVRWRWWECLENWRNRSLFATSPLPLDLPALIGSDRFREIRTHLSKIRPLSLSGGPADRNNFADALSLTMMLELTKQFKQGETNRLPRFYDPFNWFANVASELKLASGLQIEVCDTEPTSVLVQTDYMRCKVSFAVTGPSGCEIAIDDLYKELSGILGTQKRADVVVALNSVRLGPNNRLLVDVLRDLVQCGFLENVWLAEIASGELRDLASRLNANHQIEAIEGLSQRVGTLIAKTQSELAGNAEEYAHIAKIWVQFEDGILDLRNNRPQMIPITRAFDAIRDLRLTRFMLSPEACQIIREIMGVLLQESGDEEALTSSASWARLVGICMTGRSNPFQAECACAMLWATEAYASILDFLGQHVKAGASSGIDMLYAAACIQSGQRLDEAKRLTESLATRMDALMAAQWQKETQSCRDLIDHGIALGYLNFHIWQYEGGVALWRSAARKRDEPEKLREFLDSAIERCGQALAAFAYLLRMSDTHDTRLKYAYVLNQRLYYLVERGYRDDFAEMEEVAREFEAIKGARPSDWQYTFDDTLSRHLHLLAVCAGDLGRSEKLLDAAIARSEEAMRHFPPDAVVQHNYHLLLRARESRMRMVAS